MAKVHLTKSRFKIGVGCPTKLYYLDRPEYGNTDKENAFLQALAEGGFQVGELAKLYHEGGTEVATLNKVEALAQTNALLQQPSVIIYEAAIQHENLFIRADVLIKNGSSIRIVEVKAKSYDPREEDQFFTKGSLKKGPKKVNSDWKPYLLDVAFQCYVVEKAFPRFQVGGSLMLADKSAVASVDGLNQRFFLKQVDGRVGAKVRPGTIRQDLGEAVLVTVSADEAIKILRASAYDCAGTTVNFEKLVELLSNACEHELFISPIVGPECKGCEFRIGDELKTTKRSGFEQCWNQGAQLQGKDFARPFVFDIWNFRKSGKLIEAGTYFMDALTVETVAPSSDGKPGLSSSERQWLQVDKVQRGDTTAFIDREGLKREASTWTYPLHFIDFETSMVAIPFHAGRRPYEQIAFQFSHHRVDADGTITHVDQFLHRDKGQFPNFEFVRALKASLSADDGTIFRYSAHENTVLCQIKEQLRTSQRAPADRDELIQFIDSVTCSSGPQGRVEGERCMVDLCELVKRYYYSPPMRGSNSIKKVLPAVLNDSAHLRSKYSRPVYGSAGGIPSLNFRDWVWIKTAADGSVLDPYACLPPVFTDLDLADMESLITDSSLADGGAAMTAYSRMQFTEMSAEESDRVAAALLKYCELDTFAMVLIWEHWHQELLTLK